MTLFWLRDETRATEQRTPIVPGDAARLMAAGHDLVVEKSDKRIFSDRAYAAIGARLVPSGSWPQAPRDAVIVGIKELQGGIAALRHRFIHFAHIFKDQQGWREELGRFEAGGGTLYDIEYLVDESGKRLAAFSYWAGWIGAAIGVLRLLERRSGKNGPAAGIAPFADRDDVLSRIKTLARQGKPIKALVVGAKGKSGRGAVELLTETGSVVTEWDVAETIDLDRPVLLSHDLLVNCVLVKGAGLVLLRPEDLRASHNRISMIADVSCDPHSSYNPLPIYDRPTSWAQPVVTVAETSAGGIVELTAIDNLPSLMPKDASEDFSASFAPALQRFPAGAEWHASLAAFEAARERAALQRKS